MAQLKRMPLVMWEQVAQLHKGWANREHTTKEWVICNPSTITGISQTNGGMDLFCDSCSYLRRFFLS
ncbi:hypothetical protein Zm00014a_040803 [Zea mays]|uniref:Uncharacterized protein n=1 Tax=Zea mays TaxID=4577 RepID=A0A3L6E608_MAIZE|nr:hypothetical protein Zm00014a_040803 [Zea mays]PWZ16355.1 hypothetical protein Zm00014a_040803 [Zea mays]